MDSIFNEYISIHNKNIVLPLVNNDLKLMFDKEISPHIQCELRNNQRDFHLTRIILIWTELIFERGYELSHISELCITTVSSIKNNI